MKTLDAHGDDYRNAQLTILLEVKLCLLSYMDICIVIIHALKSRGAIHCSNQNI